MKVQNMRNKNGLAVPNQFIIEDGDNTYFQSYDSIIVKKVAKIEYKPFFGLGETVYLDEKYWNYSNTTSKYRNIFLNETKKETEAKIKSGEYILCNLN